jgi:rhodanese-related sulfurtransferase
MVAVGPPADWAGLAAWLAGRYPDVRSIGVDALAAWLADGARPRPWLVDCRSAEEQAISTLPDAHRVNSPEDGVAAAAAFAPDHPIVVYCAVGVRSSRLANRLLKAGHTEVLNLEGAIFAWANRGLPLTGPGGQTTQLVHPYDATWCALLAPERRAALLA